MGEFAGQGVNETDGAPVARIPAADGNAPGVELAVKEHSVAVWADVGGGFGRKYVGGGRSSFDGVPGPLRRYLLVEMGGQARWRRIAIC